ncbi:MAG: adaptor protein MecA [Eubacteriales bacterium]|nr:adaptor protein MecA [Eubacteriales bacterium]
MKIEKINDNQIRCTLTKEDLANHEIRLSELAYGTDKAKRLFREMMQQANIQFGFEADNTPLMIEAIPINMESIILIVTKVEDPDELDTRFSKFSPYKGEQVPSEPIQFDGADNIIDIFQKLCEAKLKKTAKTEDVVPNEKIPEEKTESAISEPVDLLRLFTFHSLDDVICASHSTADVYDGNNMLFKDEKANAYLLVLHQSSTSVENFNKTCNILSEYATGKAFTSAAEAYLLEHGELISANALQQLSQL